MAGAKGRSGGARQGGGRKKGSPNKASQARQAKAAAEGILPLDVMLSTMRELWTGGEHMAACALAKDAAPYLHPKLASVEMGQKDGKPFVVKIVRFGDRTSGE